MAKYFTIDRIKQAIQHLSHFDSKWILPPFVFASNGVTIGNFVNLQNARGTDAFLRRFFSGGLIGLPKKGNGDSLRPKFSEIGGPLPDPLPADLDLVLHQRQVLWGSLYSRNGYREMVEADLLNREGQSKFKLTPLFKAAFEENIDPSFCFEELLVWIFAFDGIPETCNTWQELWNHFRVAHLNGDDFPGEYKGRFYIRIGEAAVPWPAAFLPTRPDNAEYQKQLLPSEFFEPLPLNIWKDILARLVAAAKERYRGIQETELERICETVISGLISTKRVFLLGDPGVGKSEFMTLIADAFDSVLPDERLLSISLDVTEKTTETSLVGFAGIDGRWIDGALMSLHNGKRLLNAVDQKHSAAVRGQVNLILLNEANRQDVEALLAKLQTALDCVSLDAFEPGFVIPLAASGDHRLSPFTYLVMTGNSPRDDQGRNEQSRPFKRRMTLVHLPNPLIEQLKAKTPPLTEILVGLWSLYSTESLLPESDRSAFASALADPSSKPAIDGLERLLIAMSEHKAGVSYGLLKKLLILSANRRAMKVDSVSALIDYSAVSGLGPLLLSASPLSGVSIRDRLMAENLNDLPRLKDWCERELSQTDEFGTVPAGL